MGLSGSCVGEFRILRNHEGIQDENCQVRGASGFGWKSKPPEGQPQGAPCLAKERQGPLGTKKTGIASERESTCPNLRTMRS